MNPNRKINIIDTTLKKILEDFPYSISYVRLKKIINLIQNIGIDLIFFEYKNLNQIIKRTDEEIYKILNSIICINIDPKLYSISDLMIIKKLDINTIRINVDILESSIARQYINISKKLGMIPIISLNINKQTSIEYIINKSLLLQDLGADIIIIKDNLGLLYPNIIKYIMKGLYNNLKIPFGFSSSNSLGLAMTNILIAVNYGAEYIDASLNNIDNNTSTESLIAILDRLNYNNKYNFDRSLENSDYIYNNILKNRYKDPYRNHNNLLRSMDIH